MNIGPFDSRQTPFHKAHSTEVAGLHDNPCGDDRFFNNLFVGRGNLGQYDEAPLPVLMDGNVFLDGARPSRHEANPLVKWDLDPGLKLVEAADGCNLEFTLDTAWAADRIRTLVTTQRLGKARIPDLPYEQPDGTAIRVNTDYFGKPRNEANPTPGPFENPGAGKVVLKVW
jgi:alpha-N-arabinofuranosidase